MESVALRDGSQVRIRPIRPSDKKRLQEGLERLSAESRYKRFLTPLDHLSRSQLRYFTEVDHHGHEALLAVSDDEREEPIGVARFVRLKEQPDCAEVAVTVVDAWQRRGVATALLQRLAARARDEGIERFTATCLARNHDVIQLLHDLGVAHDRPVGAGLLEVRVDLPPHLEPDAPLAHTLRAAARGDLEARLPG